MCSDLLELEKGHGRGINHPWYAITFLWRGLSRAAGIFFLLAWKREDVTEITLYRRTRGCWTKSQNLKEVLHAAVADLLKFQRTLCAREAYMNSSSVLKKSMDVRLEAIGKKKTYCPYEIPAVENSWWVGKYWVRNFTLACPLQTLLENTDGSLASASVWDLNCVLIWTVIVVLMFSIEI